MTSAATINLSRRRVKPSLDVSSPSPTNSEPRSLGVRIARYRFFFIPTAALTLAGIFFWRHALGLRSTAVQIAFGLLCGGIVGNLVDRLMHGHVIDFIDLHFGSYIYPTFNVADSGICVGVLFYLWLNLREPS